MSEYTRSYTLEDLAVELSYETIKELGLYRELENSEWDSLAEKFGNEILEKLKERIAERFLEIGEQRREALEAAA